MNKPWFVKIRIGGQWKVIFFQDQGGNQLLNAKNEPGMRPIDQVPGKAMEVLQ